MNPDVGHVYDGRDLEALSDLPNYYEWIVTQFAPYVRGAGIELGAGIGTVSSRVLPHLMSLELVEPSANLTAALRSRFAGRGNVRISAMSLEERMAGSDRERFDTIVMVNVLEHIADDEGALASLHRILRPQGHLLLFVPAIPWLFSAFDREVGHFRRYRRIDLHGRLMAAGFEIVTLSYMDLLGVVPWWLFQTVGGGTSINPGMARLYDRIGVPVTRTIERFWRPPIGKNLIAVARRN